MNRRDFLGFLGGVAANLPLAARGQQSKLPVVGYLTSQSSSNVKLYLPAVRQGLQEAGLAEGRDFTFEARSADGQYDRLPGLIAELIRREAAVIVAAGGSEPAKLA